MGKAEAPISDEHAKAIGQATANFALLELSISIFIWFLIGGRDLSFEQQALGQAITARLGFQSLVLVLDSLFRHRIDNPSAIEALDDLLKRVSAAREKRNQVTHSYWGVSGTEETLTRFKTTVKLGKGLIRQSEQMSVEDVNSIADFIARVTADLQGLMFFLLDQGLLSWN